MNNDGRGSDFSGIHYTRGQSLYGFLSNVCVKDETNDQKPVAKLSIKRLLNDRGNNNWVRTGNWRRSNYHSFYFYRWRNWVKSFAVINIWPWKTYRHEKCITVKHINHEKMWYWRNTHDKYTVRRKKKNKKLQRSPIFPMFQDLSRSTWCLLALTCR